MMTAPPSGSRLPEHRTSYPAVAVRPSEERRSEPARRSERIARRSRLGNLFGALGLLVLGAAGLALAGGRARQGGTLGVCLVAKTTEADPLYADTPTDAAALMLTRTPLCRLAELSRPSPSVLRLTLLPGVPASMVAAQIRAALAESSPYRSLLPGLTRVAEAKGAVELVGAQPDAERVLCHPAFAVPLGPFKGSGPELVAVAELPEGRPYLDGVSLTVADARGAERLLAQRRVQLVLGSTQSDEGPQLFVLTLVLPPALGPHLRQALDAAVDRADLVRFFLRAPASPMPGLLPPALGGTTALPTPAPRPAPRSPAREVSLLFDDSAGDQRAIAERLQVKLQPLGYRVALKGLGRKALKSHVQADDELMLVAVLVPPSPLGALLVMLDVAQARERIAPLLGALTSSPELDARVREQATALLPQLSLWPVATRGLGITQGREVQHLTRDPLGLPRLDDAFFAPE